MKLQHLIIIFLIVMLPLGLIMSQYTSLQIDTLSIKTKYDTALLSSTFDTMSAFELNTINSDASSVVGEEIRDLEAVISTFTTSLATNLGMSNASSATISTYIPALVFGLYDGYYIYAQNDTETGRELKPYVYYTKTYTRGNTNITIAYSLDNYVSIYGTYNGKTISASGYLVIPEDVVISPDFSYVMTADEERGTKTEVLNPGTKSGGQKSWITYKGYDICQEMLYENKALSRDDGMLLNQPKSTTEAMMYYYEAKQFTELYNDVVSTLGLQDQLVLEIKEGNDPEDENSLFMNEKVNVIKDSITKNLNNAIYNYEGGVSVNYEMPQLTGEDWQKILNNVSIIAFIKDIPIGTTTYNNYVVVNSTTNQKYNSAKAIDFIEYVKDVNAEINSYGYYHKITCDELIDDIESGVIDEIIGYASVDFERYKNSSENTNDYYYYYKHNEYADYECEVETIENQNVATMQEYINNKTTDLNTRNKILKAYYTAVGRIRYRLVKASSYINLDASKSFTVRYYPNGGSWSYGNPEIVSTNIGKLQVISEKPSIVGKAFVGWSSTPDATVADVKMGDAIYGQDGRTVNLYAVYSNQYTITYYTNGGEGGPTPNVQTKVANVDYIIPGTRPIRANSVFLGWSTNPVATVPEYVAGDIYSGNNNLTLYAVWSETKVKITYNTMGGSYIPSQEKGVNATITLQGTPVLIGATFRGWSTRQNGSVEYMPGSQYSGHEDLTLYALWSAVTYRITYNANGGVLSNILQDVANCTKTYGLYYRIPDSKPTRDQYEFIGWSRNPNALVPDKDYAPGAWYRENADLTLYAVWESGSYSIVYDANGGTDAPTPQTANKSSNITISTNKPTREGYEFVGWSTSNTASEREVQYRGGETYTGRTSMMLYAVWRQKTYTITYNANGGSPTPSSQTKRYGESIYITTSRPSRTHYYFVGWSKNANSKTADYYPNQVYRDNQSVTLYAVWSSAGFFSITYDANGGIGEPDIQQEIPIGTNATISTKRPTRSGYTFLGWSKNRTATTPDSNYAPGKTYSGPSDLQLYAIWGANNQKLIVNPNKGTWRNATTSTTLNMTANSTTEIEKPTPPTGYAFLEWEVTSGDATLMPTISGNYEVTMGISDTTIVAKYTKRYYIVSYNKNTTSVVTNMPSSINKEYQSKVTISETVPKRTGYTFLGWSENKLSTTPNSNYAPGKTFNMPSSNVTLYAIWKVSSGSTGALTVKDENNMFAIKRFQMPNVYISKIRKYMLDIS